MCQNFYIEPKLKLLLTASIVTDSDFRNILVLKFHFLFYLIVIFLLQWNCNGYFFNYKELRVLLHDLQPNVIVIQKTIFRNYNLYSPTGYVDTVPKSSGHNIRPGKHGGLTSVLQLLLTENWLFVDSSILILSGIKFLVVEPVPMQRDRRS